MSGFAEAEWMVPFWVLMVVMGIVGVLIAGIIGLVWHYRRMRAASVEQRPESILPNLSAWHPDRRDDLSAQLAEVRERYKHLHQHYNVLATRYRKLVQENQRLQPLRAPSPPPASSASGLSRGNQCAVIPNAEGLQPAQTQ